MHLGLNVNRLWFFNFKEGSSILFSRRFVESRRRIDNCIKDTLMLLKNILGKPRNKLSIILGDSTNIREVLIPFAAFLGGPLIQNKEKMENRELSCQSFSEILRISEKIWHETHQYLKQLSQIKEPSLKFKKTRSSSHFDLDKSIQAKKQA